MPGCSHVACPACRNAVIRELLEDLNELPSDQSFFWGWVSEQARDPQYVWTPEDLATALTEFLSDEEDGTVCSACGAPVDGVVGEVNLCAGCHAAWKDRG